MSREVEITLDGETLAVRDGLTLAAALERAGVRPEGAAIFCGMGSCFACLVTVDGRDGVRACLQPVRAGMAVATRRPAP